MEEKIIKFSTAQLAKEKGFDIIQWYSRNASLYTKEGKHTYYANYGMYNSGLDDGYILSSTQSLLQKWLREVHSIDISIETGANINGFIYFVKISRVINNNYFSEYIIDKELEKQTTKWLSCNKIYESYEKALEDGLIYGLSFI